jgi:hypothetical protein
MTDAELRGGAAGAARERTRAGRSAWALARRASRQGQPARASRERLKAHQERLRAYHHERIGDSPATVGVTVIDVTPIHDRLIVKRFEHAHAQPATSHGDMC